MRIKIKNKIHHCTCTLAVLLLLQMSGILSFDTFAAQTFTAPDKIKYPELEFRLPQVERVLLDNGMIMFYLHNNELPLISISMLLRTGSLHDPLGKEGLAELTAEVMRTGGTSKMSSSEMDRRLDFLAASPFISASLDSTSVAFSFLNSDLDACLDLLSQMIISPAFEEGKLRSALLLKNEELRRIADNPQKLAFREFNRLIYPDDPRGRYATSTSLQQITRDDLIAFHREYFFPANIMLAVTGDISKDEAVRKIKQYFGGWENSRPAPNIPEPPKKKGQGVFLIRKQIPQSTVVTGELTLGKNNPDFYAFSILDFIIGSGGFPSRIFSAVRNNEGLAYSAGSFYRARSNYGMFGTYAFTKTASTFQALHLINSILRDASTGSLSQDELNWAKKSILSGFIFSFEQPHQIAVQQMTVAFDKLPLDYLNSYRGKINEVTCDDLKRIAAKHLNEKNRLTLIVGDADQFGQLPKSMTKPFFIFPQQ